MSKGFLLFFYFFIIIKLKLLSIKTNKNKIMYRTKSIQPPLIIQQMKEDITFKSGESSSISDNLDIKFFNESNDITRKRKAATHITNKSTHQKQI
jgi:hypothetical protein